jgi:Holliday junction resolvasome RuvABC DNA-binding subunit
MSSNKEVINIDEELKKATKAMNDATEALLNLGFSEDQWEQISKYIAFAIIHGQWQYAKARANQQ